MRMLGAQATVEAVDTRQSEGAPAAALGVTLHSEADGGGASFRVWAPHASTVAVELKDGAKLPLQRDGDVWAARFAPGAALWVRLAE